MDANEIRILTDRLIPRPRAIRFGDGENYLVQDGCKVVLNLGNADGASELAARLIRRYWQCEAKITVNADAEAGKLEDEAYRVSVTPEALTVTAAGAAGVHHAFKTLRQLAEVRRGTERVGGYFIVPCGIEDAPELKFRGVHICIFPETPLWDVEKQLRIAAYHKFNYAVIESWGVFPFESHPEFCWADRKIDRAELKRLIRLGKELGITLVPQYNLLGHASAARSVTGKHCTLDYAPELQPLFEPDGWTWCVSNPETRRILTDLVLELYDFYERPPYFHIGCDEAHNIGTCQECRKRDLKELVRDHITYFRDLLAARGSRVIMWHDMLIRRSDERWKGYTAYGQDYHHLDELYRELPPDIIIADWQYDYLKKSDTDPEPSWPTVRFFARAGFDVLVCPWMNPGGTASLGRLAAREGLFGMLETTWHILHDRKYLAVYAIAPSAAWNPRDLPPVTTATRMILSHHVRQIGWDMKLSGYERAGYSQYQVDAGHHPHERW